LRQLPVGSIGGGAAHEIFAGEAIDTGQCGNSSANRIMLPRA